MHAKSAKMMNLAIIFHLFKGRKQKKKKESNISAIWLGILRAAVPVYLDGTRLGGCWFKASQREYPQS